MTVGNTLEAQDWFRDIIIGGVPDEHIHDIAVGDGDATLSPEDTSLDNELHRASLEEDSTVSITNTATEGEILCEITISGGTEVPAGATIREFGLFARDESLRGENVTDSDDIMLFREVTTGASLDSGVRKTYEFTVDINADSTSSDSVVPLSGQDWIISKALGESAFETETANTLAVGSLEKEATLTYSSTQDVYSIDEDMRDDGIIDVVDAGGDTYTEGVDYEEADTNSDSSDDGIDWGIGGDSPNDGEDFTVTYEIDNTVSESDTSLNNQIYSTTTSSDNSSVEATSNVGQFSASVSVTGGDEIVAGERVSEFGVFSSDGTLLYKEVFEPVTVDADTTQTLAASRITVVRD